MIKKTIISLTLIFILSGCAQKIVTRLGDVIYKKIDDDTKIFILKENQRIPKNSNYVGKVKVGDTGFTSDCNYVDMLERAKYTARKTGANIIRVIEVKQPNFWSNCYRLEGELFRNFNKEVLVKLSKKSAKLD